MRNLAKVWHKEDLNRKPKILTTLYKRRKDAKDVMSKVGSLGQDKTGAT